jgi:non-specific serine/threonine protein kinase
VLLTQGDYAGSQALSEEALVLDEEADYQLGTANTLSNLGLAIFLQGDERRAAELFARGLRLFRELGDAVGAAECLEGLALGRAGSEPELLARLFGAAERQRSSIGVPQPSYLGAAYSGYLDAARSRLGDAGWAAQRAEGASMALDQAIAQALGEPGSS